MRPTEIVTVASLRLRCTPASGTTYDLNHTQQQLRLPEGAKLLSLALVESIAIVY